MIMFPLYFLLFYLFLGVTDLDNGGLMLMMGRVMVKGGTIGDGRKRDRWWWEEENRRREELEHNDQSP